MRTEQPLADDLGSTHRLDAMARTFQSALSADNNFCTVQKSDPLDVSHTSSVIEPDGCPIIQLFRHKLLRTNLSTQIAV